MQRIEATTELSTLAATDATASTIAGGQAYMADVARRLAPYVARSQSRHRAQAYVQGLLSEAERQNSWQVAEVCGESTPYGCQSLLSRADWDANAVRDELHIYVIQHLGDPNGVLVLDETGFLKQGEHSAGVARQDSGTAGTVENCQSGVLLSYASPLGHALLDRERYLPKAWTDEGARCRQAGIPADRPFATTPQLAQQRLNRAFTAGVPVQWITGDSLYGTDRRVRLGLEAQPQPMSWPSRAKNMSGGRGGHARSRPSWPRYLRRAGAGSVRATAPQAPAGMTGAGCPWPHRWRPAGAAGCESGAV
jgi:hypothetical protein